MNLEDYSKEDQETIKAAIAKGEEALANPELDRDDANKVIKQLVKALAVKPNAPTTPDKPGTGSGTETKPGTGSGTETKPGTGSGSTTTKPGSGTTTTVNPSKGQSNANTGVENKAGLFGSLGVGAASLAGIRSGICGRGKKRTGRSLRTRVRILPVGPTLSALRRRCRGGHGRPCGARRTKQPCADSPPS